LGPTTSCCAGFNRLKKLFDPAEMVRNAALDVVKKCCVDDDFLERFLEHHPNIDFFTANDISILYRFLEISPGFQYLKNNDFLREEFNYWLEVWNYL
jgi:hypothetical protein